MHPSAPLTAASWSSDRPMRTPPLRTPNKQGQADQANMPPTVASWNSERSISSSARSGPSISYASMAAPSAAVFSSA